MYTGQQNRLRAVQAGFRGDAQGELRPGSEGTRGAGSHLLEVRTLNHDSHTLERLDDRALAIGPLYELHLRLARAPGSVGRLALSARDRLLHITEAPWDGTFEIEMAPWGTFEIEMEPLRLKWQSRRGHLSGFSFPEMRLRSERLSGDSSRGFESAGPSSFGSEL
jgi:hypothetical protein